MRVSNTIIAIFISLFIASCTGQVSRVQTTSDQYIVERNNSMELLDLLQEFTSGNSWETGQDNIHINWLTPIHIVDNKSEEYVDAFLYKKGSLHITLDSAFTDFYNRERAHPVPWSIHMYGGRTMYLDCMIKTDTTGGGEDEIEKYLEKKNVLKQRFYFKYKKGQGAWGIPNYTWLVIKLKDGRDISVLHEGFYMNYICDHILYFNSDGSDRITFPKTFFQYYADTTKHTEEQPAAVFE